MDTIKGFVDTVWRRDDDITRNAMPHPAEVWSKPDPDTGSLELRRITTRQSVATPSFPHGVRSDFYELYWADLSAGSTLDQVENWIFGLLWRNPLCWQMHRAAPFAATRWTNIHDPARFIFCGDLISGPLAPLFGPAIIDVDLRALRGQSWGFTHTKYWASGRDGDPVPPHVVALRGALNLAGQCGDL
jgi:hypothetical protein